MLKPNKWDKQECLKLLVFAMFLVIRDKVHPYSLIVVHFSALLNGHRRCHLVKSGPKKLTATDLMHPFSYQQDQSAQTSETQSPHKQFQRQIGEI